MFFSESETFIKRKLKAVLFYRNIKIFDLTYLFNDFTSYAFYYKWGEMRM